MVSEFDANMKLAGKKLTLKSFDADHGFANPSNPIYDKVSTEAAWDIAIRYLKTKLK